MWSLVENVVVVEQIDHEPDQSDEDTESDDSVEKKDENCRSEAALDSLGEVCMSVLKERVIEWIVGTHIR